MKIPPLTPVTSKNLQSVGFSTSGLFVRFVGGATYRYPEAPKSVYDRLVSADSPGREFQSLVRGKYVHHQILDA